ncbi:hypothetical protein SARC_09422 [Sphaeroforma arctica JP610]|uniref:Uncharacterized protein n=1 Tax=Sphaeroforma arctica JP610 TaxID=667725 RepID=A0A0L0FN23_9EUKA|nr:hypothetical protein SARC_09422 [Sphaeroforma arctica JP610]KNC78134.1 hypothetical protein SARC_09422 [Sphaeroforma arctica JP610]|eukprot:XP_014152036.1 hypothetical protein SARC_09422 [Sphaeroforma arctica JP610]
MYEYFWTTALHLHTLIDKIIAMADNNVAPGVKEFEEVLQLVVKYKDLHGIDVLLKAAKEKGHYDNLNEELVDKAYGMMEA